MVIRSNLCLLFMLLFGACEALPLQEVASQATLLSGGREGLLQARRHEPNVSIPVLDTAAEMKSRRMRLAAEIGEGVVWVECGSGSDLDRYFQEDDFYYLTGVEIPNIAFGMKVDEKGKIVDEVLLLPPRDSNYELWNGHRLSPGREAAIETGFMRTLALTPVSGSSQEGASLRFIAMDPVLDTWDPKIIHSLATPSIALPDGVKLDTKNLAHALITLRMVKSDYEIDCIKAAIDITCAAIRNALYEIRPGAWEYQVQGAIEGTFLRLGAQRTGFASICGSGANTTTLHYNANRQQMESGDLVVMDVGAKVSYYTADVTRTVPVSGSFTKRQREIYDIVLGAQHAAEVAAKPGMTLRDLDRVARQYITKRGYGPYFKHGLGHWIGMNVHDVGHPGAPIEPGCLFTIEPGIYISEENLGIRIEDDYLMTHEGAVKLSSSTPSDPDAIESMMTDAH